MEACATAKGAGMAGEVEGPVELYATAKGVWMAGDEEGPVERYATAKSLKAAAAPHGLLVGYSAKGKAGSGPEAGTLAVAAAAAAIAKQAMAAAQQAMAMAAVAAVAAKKAAEAEKQAAEEAKQAAAAEDEAAAKQAAAAEDEAAAKQAAEDADATDSGSDATASDSDAIGATDSDATDSEDEEEEEGMSAIEYITTYRELPPYEVEGILARPRQRTPFTDTDMFKSLLADPAVTQEDVDYAAGEHEAREDARARFRDWVRSEYESKGHVVVDEDYIARRLRTEELANKLWEEGFARFDEDGWEDEVIEQVKKRQQEMVRSILRRGAEDDDAQQFM